MKRCLLLAAALTLAAPCVVEAQSSDVVTRYENAAHCDHVARGVIRDLEQQGGRPSALLTAFKATLFGANMRGIREVADAGVRARGVADIRAGAEAIRAQGDAALHAELRRCWTLFSDQPVPDDLI